MVNFAQELCFLKNRKPKSNRRAFWLQNRNHGLTG